MARILVCILLVMGTLLGIAGVDLVLPALPDMALWPDGGVAKAQLVIAAYIGGTAAGLLLFGSLGTRVDRRWLLLFSILSQLLLSLACAAVENLDVLIGLRLLQGLLGGAPAVFAPGMIRRLFDEKGAMRALGALGSIEALAPALAPLAGAGLVALGGWRLPFLVTGGLGVLVALCLFAGRGLLPAGPAPRTLGSYPRLLGDPVFLRYALSQSLLLGGLLVVVFSAPAVITHSMGGEMADFILMQMIGVTLFILCANLAGPLAGRIGAERLILIGTLLALVSALLLLAYALAGGNNPHLLPLLLAPMNIGLGLRGPPGFLRAVMAGRGDDDRASALVILAITLFAAASTALVAPFLGQGLITLAIGAMVMQLAATASLLALPPLPSPMPAAAAGD
ncbi:MFS transporter [Niveispirillum sp. BGYR6]|uniref:MFS transporter n=1 Tax=Niveispirillum sp. BGYR6 TaxID=2971249 RepID=UPI0022B9583F|nr:MFS transporter [Niveispirillum sp. BGYR6]MDG5495730.1 MFS transporter [Niveispirillum sp. BGYR6]